MRRTIALETIDGEECVRIPLGSKGKHGSCFMWKETWEKYESGNHSTKLRLIHDCVVNGSNQSVAKIISEADGQRVNFINGNSRDLRLRNIELVAGKSGKRIPPKAKTTRSIKVIVEFCDSGGRADQAPVIDYGFHEISLMPANDERLDKWRQKVKRNGAILRDSETAKTELFLMKENERVLRTLWADNYNPTTGGARTKGKLKRFGDK